MAYGGILGQSVSTPIPISDGGTGATTAQGARTNLEVGKTVWATATFTTGRWTKSGNVFTQTVACQGVMATMRYEPTIQLLPSTNATTAASEKEAFALLSDYGQTGDNTLTLTTSGNTRPSVNFTVFVLGELA